MDKKEEKKLKKAFGKDSAACNNQGKNQNGKYVL